MRQNTAAHRARESPEEREARLQRDRENKAAKKNEIPDEERKKKTAATVIRIAATPGLVVHHVIDKAADFYSNYGSIRPRIRLYYSDVTICGCFNGRSMERKHDLIHYDVWAKRLLSPKGRSRRST